MSRRPGAKPITLALNKAQVHKALGQLQEILWLALLKSSYILGPQVWYKALPPHAMQPRMPIQLCSPPFAMQAQQGGLEMLQVLCGNWDQHVQGWWWMNRASGIVWFSGPPS